jgi:hypothetical protein
MKTKSRLGKADSIFASTTRKTAAPSAGAETYLRLTGKKIEMPPIKQVEATFKKAARFKGEKSEQFEIREPK